MSAHLHWLIVRNNHAYLMKKRNIGKAFSTERGNLANVNSFRYNGCIHKKTVTIEDAPDKKGVTVTYKKARAQNKPRYRNVKTTMKSGPRRLFANLKRLLKSIRYRPDLRKIALQRACVVLKSQKAKKIKKARAKKQE